MLRELIERVGRIDIVGTPTWTTNASLRGLQRMDVVLTPLSARGERHQVHNTRRRHESTAD